MKRELGEIYKLKDGETYIKTINGTKTYYRFIVEDYIGFELPEGYSVHHLDFDHENNTLDNLLIIRTPLHVWLHRTNGTQDLFVSNIEKIKRNPKIILGNEE